MLNELASVGRENQPSDRSPKIKDGLSALHQTLGIGVILIGLVTYVLNMRADVNANREAITGVRSEIAIIRSEAASSGERLRQAEIKIGRLEK